MKKDDGIRQGFAVGISLDQRVDGMLRLVLDDLEATDGSGSNWRQWAFFTSIDLPLEKAKAHRLSEREYAAVGEAVLARLVALRSL
jgi:hypothetical protein